MNRRMAIAAAVLFTGGSLLVPAGTEGATVDQIIAVVNGEIITSSDLRSAAQQAKMGLLGPLPDLKVPYADQGEGGILAQLIDTKLQMQLARKRGITVGSDEIQRALDDVKQKNGIPSDAALDSLLREDRFDLASYKEVLRDQITILKLINREVRAGVVLSDEEVRTYYQEQLDRRVAPKEYHLRQILLPVPSPDRADTVQQAAEAVISQLRSGADFPDMARRYSSGPESKLGGDLGNLSIDQMRPEVREAIEPLQPGEISGPVRTSAGYHIFRLEELRPSQPRPFDEIKGEMQAALFRERAAELYEKWLKDLRSAAQVEIKFRPLGNGSRATE